MISEAGMELQRYVVWYMMSLFISNGRLFNKLTSTALSQTIVHPLKIKNLLSSRMIRGISRYCLEIVIVCCNSLSTSSGCMKFVSFRDLHQYTYVCISSHFIPFYFIVFLASMFASEPQPAFNY